ncbi:hypothetical protein HPP92_016835 [Vanilla planifolia]|uniref:Uncharacterized protein n=1 Tax=Vanilla planifolia TaxID=51239 RepID=A0A835QM83_VANPL|nr:hypothetical protein HPP92_016835 [Vanilla planifolia]
MPAEVGEVLIKNYRHEVWKAMELLEVFKHRGRRYGGGDWPSICSAALVKDIQNV